MLYLVQSKWYDREEFWKDEYCFDTHTEAEEYIQESEMIDWAESVAMQYRILEVNSDALD